MNDDDRLEEIQRRLDRLAEDGWDSDDLAGALRRHREAPVVLRRLGNALRNALVGRLDADEHSEDIAR